MLRLMWTMDKRMERESWQKIQDMGQMVATIEQMSQMQFSVMQRSDFMAKREEEMRGYQSSVKAYMQVHGSANYLKPLELSPCGQCQVPICFIYTQKGIEGKSVNFYKSQNGVLKTEQLDNPFTEMKNQKENESYTFVDDETTCSKVSENSFIQESFSR